MPSISSYFATNNFISYSCTYDIADTWTRRQSQEFGPGVSHNIPIATRLCCQLKIFKRDIDTRDSTNAGCREPYEELIENIS